MLEQLWQGDYVPLIALLTAPTFSSARQSGVLADRDDFDTNSLILAELNAPVVVSAHGPDILARGLAALEVPDRRRGMDQLSQILSVLPAFVQATAYRWHLGREGIDFGLGLGRLWRGFERTPRAARSASIK